MKSWFIKYCFSRIKVFKHALNQLRTQKAIATDCFDEFIVFKRTHESLFTNEVKQRILKTAGAIVASVSGVNKSELILLAKLSIEFKKLIDEKSFK